ncbi:hypothetical protein RI367_008195 [Sorochytrium milnesiophthora]
MSVNRIVIPDTEAGYPLDQFVIPGHYRNSLASVLIPHGLIIDRVEKLAHDIRSDTRGPLNLMDRFKKLQPREGESTPLHLDFIKVRSYENTSSTGNVHISLSEQELQAIKGKHLLLVEDIIDTGTTMVALLARLKQYSPASVRVVSLFVKRTPKSNGYIPDYVGFEIPDQFIVGYALDYNEYFRDLDHVCVINDHGKQTYAV